MNGKMEHGRKHCGLCGINGFDIDKISLSFYGEKRNMSKYIFLDIDGVLNSMDWFEQNKYTKGYTEINPGKVKLLKEIVDRTDAKIILSSTWRSLAAHDDKPEHEMYTYLRTSLEEFGLSISDQTPYIQQNRPQEIKAWLENNTNEDDRYVSLDDDYSYDAYKECGIEKCLVKTSFYEPNGGLRKEHVEEAIKILNGE